MNEFLKCSCENMLEVFVKYFNLILKTGIVPEEWSKGIIIPIYKNKGDKGDPNNYRGISLLSCLSKVFTACIKSRIQEFVETQSMMGEEQTGFRTGYSTTNHIFNLKCIIDMYLMKRERLYVAFIDYQKAFDSVNRAILWTKLLSTNINGKVLNVIKNLYEKAKSNIMTGEGMSEFFNCTMGVRQGENLSPLLFALFINDMSNYISKYYGGLNHVSTLANELLNDKMFDSYIKLYLLLYADDTIVMAESREDLQLALNGLSDYTKKSELKVNIDKSKIIVFSRGKIRNIPDFWYEGKLIEVVFEYTYLGVIFSNNGTFKKAKTKLVDQANRAMFGLLQRIRALSLPLDMSIDLFDKTVLPILLYGCEVWGFEACDIIEKLHLKFLKILLGVRNSTCSEMVYGETGRLPLRYEVKSRMVVFWYKISNSIYSNISKFLYDLILRMYQSNTYISPWISEVKTILENCGMSNVWTAKFCPEKAWLKCAIKQKLYDVGIQEWQSRLSTKKSCALYTEFKTTFKLENYLLLLSQNMRKIYCKLRVKNYNIPINNYMFKNGDKSCKLCESKIADEQHYLLQCRQLDSLRQAYIIPHVNSSISQNQQTLQLLKTTDLSTLKDICIFLIKLSKIIL